MVKKMTIELKQTFLLNIKGDKFELTLDEIKLLKSEIDKMIGVQNLLFKDGYRKVDDILGPAPRRHFDEFTLPIIT